MKIVVVGLLLACAICSPLLAQPKNDAYQNGTIVGMDGVSANASAEPQLESNVTDHEISIQVGDTVYVCRYHTSSDQDSSWLYNKTAQVKIQGKVLYVKRATGKDARAQIVSATKVTQP
jgi:hypothetical protein